MSAGVTAASGARRVMAAPGVIVDASVADSPRRP